MAAGPRQPVVTLRAVPAAMMAALLLGGCSGDSGGSPPTTRSEEPSSAMVTAQEPEQDSATGATYLRTVVFVDTSRDTAMFVPWDFENRDWADGVHRTVRGWLGRGTQWSLFMDDQWVTQPSRVPWRAFPRGAARLVVGPDDALQEIYYQEGIRDLSVRFGEVLAEWSDPRVGTHRLLSGTASLSGARNDGLILDAFTVRDDQMDGSTELALLAGGDLIVLVAAPQGSGPHRAWARRGSDDLFWPSVEIDWVETRSFDQARRDVPVLWRFESRDGTLSGEFESVSAHHKTLDGTGPVLPVLAVYEVGGHVVTDGTRTAVRGFLRHSQR